MSLRFALGEQRLQLRLNQIQHDLLLLRRHYGDLHEDPLAVPLHHKRRELNVQPEFHPQGNMWHTLRSMDNLRTEDVR